MFTNAKPQEAGPTFQQDDIVRRKAGGPEYLVEATVVRNLTGGPQEIVYCRNLDTQKQEQFPAQTLVFVRQWEG